MTSCQCHCSAECCTCDDKDLKSFVDQKPYKEYLTIVQHDEKATLSDDDLFTFKDKISVCNPCDVETRMLMPACYVGAFIQCVMPWVVEPLSKWGAQVDVKTIENFCGLNWQLRRHKH